MTGLATYPIACAQLNTTVGDFAGNVERIVLAAQRALVQGARMLVCPEMTVTGYPAEDWLLREDFCLAAQNAIRTLQERLLAVAPGLTVVVGGVRLVHGKRRAARNTLFVLAADATVHTYDKRHLPEYGVFDEGRVFEAGEGVLVLEVAAGLKVGFAICEDLWFEDVAQELKAAGADFIVSINASPWEKKKRADREATVIGHAAAVGLPPHLRQPHGRAG